MTADQAATLKRLAEAVYEREAFKPNLTRAEAGCVYRDVDRQAQTAWQAAAYTLRPMLNPLKWKYEGQVGLLVSAIAGAGFGILIGYRSENGWLGTVIWVLIGAVAIGGAFYFARVADEG